MRYKGKLIMTRPSGPDPEEMVITLTDEMSGSQCVEIHAALPEFTRALTSSFGECEFEWRPLVVGMKREHKTEAVPFKWTLHGSRDAEDAALAPFEVDGWKARREDLANPHRRIRDGMQTVTFVRFVSLPASVQHVETAGV